MSSPMIGHYIEKCVHGTVGGQCRCPNPNKTVLLIDCPDNCPRKPGSDEMKTHRRFILQRDEDVTGVSGTGVVAEGVEFSDGVVTLHWKGQWPSSVVHYDRGMESVQHVHGHDGKTRIVFLDEPSDS